MPANLRWANEREFRRLINDSSAKFEWNETSSFLRCDRTCTQHHYLSIPHILKRTMKWLQWNKWCEEDFSFFLHSFHGLLCGHDLLRRTSLASSVDGVILIAIYYFLLEYLIEASIDANAVRLSLHCSNHWLVRPWMCSGSIRIVSHFCKPLTKSDTAEIWIYTSICFFLSSSFFFWPLFHACATFVWFHFDEQLCVVCVYGTREAQENKSNVGH